MIINYNVSSMIANNALARNDAVLSKSLERLSSGYKINHAKDNAAGLAMSRRMNAQIKGLSVATLEKLIDWGWVENLEDIFNLKNYAQEWKKKEGFGEKSVSNILNSIEKAKTCELHSFIAALGIPFIGQQVAKDLCEYVYDYADFREKIYEGWNFASIPSFGQVKMQSILEFDYTVADNIAHLLTLSNTKEEKTSGLDGKTFVVTGKLKSFKNRALLKDEIEKRGGKVTDSVTSKTDFLINNDKESTSSKNTKAKELNIPIISEEEFLEMIK